MGQLVVLDALHLQILQGGRALCIIVTIAKVNLRWKGILYLIWNVICSGTSCGRLWEAWERSWPLNIRPRCILLPGWGMQSLITSTLSKWKFPRRLRYAATGISTLIYAQATGIATPCYHVLQNHSIRSRSSQCHETVEYPPHTRVGVLDMSKVWDFSHTELSRSTIQGSHWHAPRGPSGPLEVLSHAIAALDGVPAREAQLTEGGQDHSLRTYSHQKHAARPDSEPKILSLERNRYKGRGQERQCNRVALRDKGSWTILLIAIWIVSTRFQGALGDLNATRNLHGWADVGQI
ncbi:hypothetical protein SS50377_28635 [Spironucleus salmonicida]|uniref:Uncharacterized protein n=1 Tax=Spironucleus salmonicida TaxID=348837 RepID=A0A9P8LKE7_9EUKA|nr:hypothetical protein SS50377_28635 [Spironucleus salmonicida]